MYGDAGRRRRVHDLAVPDTVVRLHAKDDGEPDGGGHDGGDDPQGTTLCAACSVDSLLASSTHVTPISSSTCHVVDGIDHAVSRGSMVFTRA
jgi:hypothetical protein